MKAFGEEGIMNQRSLGTANLFIPPHTAKLHPLHIYQKLQVNTRRDAVAKAQGLGLLSSR